MEIQGRSCDLQNEMKGSDFRLLHWNVAACARFYWAVSICFRHTHTHTHTHTQWVIASAIPSRLSLCVWLIKSPNTRKVNKEFESFLQVDECRSAAAGLSTNILQQQQTTLAGIARPLAGCQLPQRVPSTRTSTFCWLAPCLRLGFPHWNMSGNIYDENTTQFLIL